MVDIFFLTRWITIILSLTGLYYIIKVLLLTRTTKMELIKARIFLNDTFLKNIMYLLAIICILFFFHAISEYLTIYYGNIFDYDLTRLLRKSAVLGIDLCVVITIILWHSILKGVHK